MKEQSKQYYKIEAFDENVFNAIPLGIDIVDENLNILYINEALANQIGREAVSRKCYMVYKDDKRQCLNCPLKEPAKIREGNTIEIDGVMGERIFKITHRDINFKGKNAIIEVFEDVTESKRAEERIREQAALLDKARDAILVRRLCGAILFWNEGAVRLYGWTAEEAVGKNANELLFKKGSSGFAEAVNAVMEKGEWMGELNHIDKKGKEIIVESHWTLMRDSENNPKSILVISTDITEKKKIESHLLRAQRMDSIGTLAGGIAHDISNVLTPILMAIQILQGKLSDDHSKWMLSTLESSARRGADIVKQVLTFARGVEGERSIIHLASMIAEMEKIIRGTFPKSIRLITDIPENLWNLYGDATQIHQILLNLCVNARDAMPGGGALTIAVENMTVGESHVRIRPDAKAGKYVMIKVSDTGTGIPPDVIDKIFEPFFTTKEIGKGTGLGLSTVQTIVKSHDGFLNVYSETGKGTTFVVYLSAVAEKAQHVEEDKIEKYQGKGELILVVDDESAIREIAKETLEMYGYKVITADDGKEAVMIYGEGVEKIKAVILDMAMPSMDGPSAIRILQNIDPQVKIIAVSGLMSDSKHGIDNSVSVQAYLHKPYTAARLLKTLNDVLNKKPRD